MQNFGGQIRCIVGDVQVANTEKGYCRVMQTIFNKFYQGALTKLPFLVILQA